jgi:hypothetical protein
MTLLALIRFETILECLAELRVLQDYREHTLWLLNIQCPNDKSMLQ